MGPFIDSVLCRTVDYCVGGIGDRGYGQLFPPDYAGLWIEVTTRCKERQERRNQALEAKEKKEKAMAAKKQSKGRTQVVSPPLYCSTC